MRLGLTTNRDREQRLPTAAELESIRQAGQRAVAPDTRVSKSGH
jgi:hypothetical protein